MQISSKSKLVAILLLAAVSATTAKRAHNRKLLKNYCTSPPMDSLAVPDSYQMFSVVGTGTITYFCNNSTLDPSDGEATATLRSDDGVWVGYFEYPVNGTLTGMPTYYLNNTKTGETRTIWGENKPQFKQPSPTGSGVSWSRRVIYGDASSLDTLAPDGYTPIAHAPRATYVIRTDTWDAGKPQNSTCKGDIDVKVPYSARYTFVSCDWWLFPSAATPTPGPAPAPGPLINFPAETPVPGPAPAPAPAPAAAAPRKMLTDPVVITLSHEAAPEHEVPMLITDAESINIVGSNLLP